MDVILGFIESEDVKGLSSLPKIGKKKAEQIILSLRGKLVFEKQTPQDRQKFTVRDEVVSALVNLGFKASEVQSVVDEMPTGISVEDGIRSGLSQLAGRGA